MEFGTPLPGTQQMPNQPAWELAIEPEAFVSVAKRADEFGYAWLPCSDHTVIPKRFAAVMGATWYEPATTLSYVAALTMRIRLLSHVVVLPYRDPLAIAKQYATLDRLSGGRVILGVGVGHLKHEFEVLGASFDERGAAADEYIEVIKALWTQDEATFRGERYTFEEQMLAPRPLQQPRPPIWVGGNSRRAARRAVELADGWVPFEAPLDVLRDRMSYVRALPAFEQRSAALAVSLPANVEITPNAIDGERRPFQGSAEQVIEDVRAYEDAGATGLTAGFRAASLDEHLELLEQFATDVMKPLAG